MNRKIGDYTGFSESGITDAIENALLKADEHTRIEIIETRSSQVGDEVRRYQVVVSTFSD